MNRIKSYLPAAIAALVVLALGASMIVVFAQRADAVPNQASWAEWGNVKTKDVYGTDADTQYKVEQVRFDSYTGELVRHWETYDATYRLKRYNVDLGPLIGWDCGWITYRNSKNNDKGFLAEAKEAKVGACGT